jgi:hypothetical protein
MGQTVTYANGASLTSDAYTIQEIGSALQPLTLDLLGIPISASSPLVRIGWPIQGAPFADSDEDICYLLATLKPDEAYDLIRYQYISQLATDPPTLDQMWNYSRTWAIKWCLYGPNALDHSRIIRSGLNLDYFYNQLEALNLYPIYDQREPLRVPELINGQWFDRVDFTCDMTEWVTEHITIPTVRSVEVHAANSDGEFADFTVTDGS